MFGKKLSSFFGILAFVAGGFFQQANAEYFDDKNVTLLVNAGAGGGQTRVAALIADNMAKHLGTGTNIVVKNIPGAGGIKGLNVLSEATKADGLTLMFGTSNAMAQLLGQEGVRFDLSDLGIIGVGSINYVTIASTDTKKGLADRSALLKQENLVIGGRSLSDGLGLFARLPIEVLGLSYKYVPGYKSQPKLNAAMQAKEIEVLGTGHIGYAKFYKDTLIAEGKAIPLFYHSPVLEDGSQQKIDLYDGTVPTFVSFYESTLGKAPSGQMWEAYKWVSRYQIRPQGLFAPPGVDEDLLRQITAAFEKTLNDQGFKKAYAKRNGMEPNFFVGDEAKTFIADAFKISDAGLEGLKKLTSKK